jgi:hypothetical protein
MHRALDILQGIAVIIASLLLLIGGVHLWWTPFRRRK